MQLFALPGRSARLAVALCAMWSATACGPSDLFADDVVVVDAGADAAGTDGDAAGGASTGSGADALRPTPGMPGDAAPSTLAGDAAGRPADDAANPDAASPDGDAQADPDASMSPGPPPDAGPPLPECECFVRAAWCGAGAAEAGLARDVPCRVPLVPAHADDLLGCQDGAWVVLEACAFGCFAAPPGTPDHCNPDPDGPTPENPGWADCAHRDQLAWGLHPEASDRLRCAGVDADRISQTIGNAAASAGYHAQDGVVDGEPYCAAVDLRTRDLDQAEIRGLLQRLGDNGFAAWYRWPGHDGWPADEAPHIHAVFAGIPMKNELEGQIDDFLVGRNGLASHTVYAFWEAPEGILDLIRLLYARHH